jgi:hypothetical protein
MKRKLNDLLYYSLYIYLLIISGYFITSLSDLNILFKFRIASNLKFKHTRSNYKFFWTLLSNKY